MDKLQVPTKNEHSRMLTMVNSIQLSALINHHFPDSEHIISKDEHNSCRYHAHMITSNNRQTNNEHQPRVTTVKSCHLKCRVASKKHNPSCKSRKTEMIRRDLQPKSPR
eukprot:INCI7241.3.p1 GENE.INCI7241.3~~INCI7241.3.p1  ORF type:complete len:109 (-),score=13.20 INCI7241.3:5-331(-)